MRNLNAPCVVGFTPSSIFFLINNHLILLILAGWVPLVEQELLTFFYHMMWNPMFIDILLDQSVVSCGVFGEPLFLSDLLFIMVLSVTLVITPLGFSYFSFSNKHFCDNICTNL